MARTIEGWVYLEDDGSPVLDVSGDISFVPADSGAYRHAGARKAILIIKRKPVAARREKRRRK